MKILIPDFDDVYQHYSDRRPPWIKLPAKLLGAFAFRRLRPAERFAFIGLLVLATDKASIEGGEGVVEASSAELAFELDLDEQAAIDSIGKIEAAGLIRVEP